METNMKFNQIINNIFKYMPKPEYNCTIIPNNSTEYPEINNTDNKKIYDNLDVNLEYIKTKYKSFHD